MTPRTMAGTVLKLAIAACSWRYNVEGQLGNGTTTDRTTPVAVLP